MAAPKETELICDTAGRRRSNVTAAHLRSLLNDAERSLGENCASWVELRLATDTPELVLEEICSVTGQAQLLISQKLAQFGGLIDDHELGRGEKVTSSTDLQGFWDMINIQIEDVGRKFAQLDEWRRNSWKKSEVVVVRSEPLRQLKRNFKKTLMSPPISVVSHSVKADGSSARRHIAEARKRLASASGRLESMTGQLNYDQPHSPLRISMEPAVSQFGQRPQ